MFEQAFRNIDDVLRKEAGCTTELDYTEQTSWLLFLKYLDGLEEDKATAAELDGKKYDYILGKKYRWESWASPKGMLRFPASKQEQAVQAKVIAEFEQETQRLEFIYQRKHAALDELEQSILHEAFSGKL